MPDEIDVDFVIHTSGVIHLEGSHVDLWFSRDMRQIQDYG
jgi:hypothetical protein